MHADSQFTVSKIGESDHFSLHTGAKISAMENGSSEAKPYIGMVDDAPEYHRYNEFIKHGYRINYHTWRSTLWSLFQCHNETINVWTHFSGFLVSLLAFIIMICNYQNVKVKSVDDTALNLAKVTRDDIDGYDLGLIHSQRAEFQVLYLSLKQYWDSAPDTQTISLAQSVQTSEL